MNLRSGTRLLLLGYLLTGGCIVGCSGERDAQLDARDFGEAREAVIHPKLTYGMRGQDSYQNDWTDNVGGGTLTYPWQNCVGFGNQLASTDTQKFYFNLHGAQGFIESGGDSSGVAQGSADVVDIFYLFTHGGNFGGSAVLAMWDNNVMVNSTSMRLGDNTAQTNGGLSVLAANSCDVLASADGGFVNRWSSTFRGGLRIAVGGWDLLYDVAGVGQSFAQRMQNGEPIGDAFANANMAADASSSPAVASAAGTSGACWPRLGATLSNILSKARVRDNSVGYYCWVHWN